MLRLVKKELNIIMTRISPKLIDVEGNRVETDDIISSCDLVNFKGDGSKMNLGVSGLKRETLKDGRSYIPSEGGRFPTQLFCNIKNDKYKYVKNIT